MQFITFFRGGKKNLSNGGGDSLTNCITSAWQRSGRFNGVWEQSVSCPSATCGFELRALCFAAVCRAGGRHGNGERRALP